MHYLDNAATTRPFPQVIEIVEECLKEHYANPSSIHPPGTAAQRLINDSRKTLAHIFRVPLAGVVFCSSGTESDNLALKGIFKLKKNKKSTLITTKLEHAAILNTAKWLEQYGIRVKYVNIHRDSGQVELKHLESIIDPDTQLVSIQHANSETGIIQDLAEISKTVRKKNQDTIIHSDGVQAFSKIPTNLKQLGVDLYSISAHKFHGIKGAGALICTKKLPLEAQLHGGGQEFGYRSGTENVAAIAAMGEAAKLMIQNDKAFNDKVADFSIWLKRGLKERLDHVKVFEAPDILPHIISISIPDIPGEVLLNHLAARDIFVGLGSACSANSNKMSEVLKTLKYPAKQIKETIRISLSPLEIPPDPQSFLDQFVQTVQELAV